ncbi:hypothetical protein CBL_10812 [Carabus blaptoides fortunei]
MNNESRMTERNTRGNEPELERRTVAAQSYIQNKMTAQMSLVEKLDKYVKTIHLKHQCLLFLINNRTSEERARETEAVFEHEGMIIFKLRKCLYKPRALEVQMRPSNYAVAWSQVLCRFYVEIFMSGKSVVARVDKQKLDAKHHRIPTTFSKQT